MALTLTFGPSAIASDLDGRDPGAAVPREALQKTKER
jgi:hypothetical protein